MKTMIATAALTVMFLSAGALAGIGSHGIETATRSQNLTVIVKNQAWPLAGEISLDPCRTNRCFDI